jgi:hypothetical protein
MSDLSGVLSDFLTMVMRRVDETLCRLDEQAEQQAERDLAVRVAAGLIVHEYSSPERAVDLAHEAIDAWRKRRAQP